MWLYVERGKEECYLMVSQQLGQIASRLPGLQPLLQVLELTLNRVQPRTHAARRLTSGTWIIQLEIINIWISDGRLISRSCIHFQSSSKTELFFRISSYCYWFGLISFGILKCQQKVVRLSNWSIPSIAWTMRNKNLAIIITISKSWKQFMKKTESWDISIRKTLHKLKFSWSEHEFRTTRNEKKV